MLATSVTRLSEVRSEPLDHRLRVPLRVRHPGVGVRGEVGVIGKDLLTGHIGGKLHQQAGVAQPNVQRIEDLGLVEPLLGDVALAERRHPEVDERAGKLCAAQAALMQR